LGRENAMRENESLSGGNPKAFLGQLRRNYLTAVRQNGGDRGPARVADIGVIGEIGLW
jgi:hypothetical protein